MSTDNTDISKVSGFGQKKEGPKEETQFNVKDLDPKSTRGNVVLPGKDTPHKGKDTSNEGEDKNVTTRRKKKHKIPTTPYPSVNPMPKEFTNTAAPNGNNQSPTK